MSRVVHVINMENEPTALADDFRGLAEMIEACDEMGVKLSFWADNYNSLLNAESEELEEIQARKIVSVVQRVGPIWPMVIERDTSG